MAPQDHIMPDATSSQPATPKPSEPTLEHLLHTNEQLRHTNEEIQRRKLDADKDKELFRELYNKASSHASEVTKENNTLVDRVELLETQLREGLVMVKSTYEARIQKLEEDVEKWKGLYGIMQIKDQKTNGDEIRRKAACEPELRRENQNLRVQLELLREDYENMEAAFEQLGDKEIQALDDKTRVMQDAIQRSVRHSGIRPAVAGSGLTQFGQTIDPRVPVS